MGWLVLGSVAAAITTLGFLPQVLKMWRTRSVEDLSPVAFFQLGLGISLWLIYGIHLQDPVIIAATIVALSIMATALVLYFRYHRRRAL